MDVFSLRDTVVEECGGFATSFTTIHAEDIRQQVEAIYAQERYWPEPLIQINSLVRSSAAEYLTFVAASGGGGVEAAETVVQDFRITAAGSKTYDTKHRDLSAIAGTGIGPRIGPSWPDSRHGGRARIWRRLGAP